MSTINLGSGKPYTGTVEDQVRYFETKFDGLADKAYKEVNSKTEPSFFLSGITRLPVSTRTQHRSFIEEKLTNIPPPVTIVKIWCILNLYWDFLNYGLLERVITKFGSEDLKQKMQDYVEKLSTFKQTTRLCDFIEYCPCKDELPSEEDLKKVVVKIQKEWSHCTLQDVELFKKDLINKFFLPEYEMLLGKAEKGCVCVTWLTSPSIATLLQQNLKNIETEFYKKHGIDEVTIDGQDIFFVPIKRYGGYLRELYASEQHPVGISPLTPFEKILPFKLARITKDKVIPRRADKFTKKYIRGDVDDIQSPSGVVYEKSSISFQEFLTALNNSQQKLILIEGASGVGKTTFSWEFCRKWGRGDILQSYSMLLLLPLRDKNLKEAKTLSDIIRHQNSELKQAVVQEITRNQGQGVAIWLEAWDELDYKTQETKSVFFDLIHGTILPFATVFVTSRPWATKHLRAECEQRISQHVEILASAKVQIAHYISKAEADGQPSSFAAKFTDYLSSNPAIKAAMSTPVTAKMSAEVFIWSEHTESSPPTTLTELFTAFTLKTLVDFLSTHPVYHKQELKVKAFCDLPADVYKQFQNLCREAYEGMLNRQQVFSAANFSKEVAPLGLMLEVPQLHTKGGVSSYHFIHLMLQEYLAALYISQLPNNKQTRLFQEHLGSGHFKMTIRFWAGLTKLKNVPCENLTKLFQSDDITLNFLHYFFEAQDTSVTTKTLGSDKMFVRSNYSWTPMDFYVTGHAISHSNSTWSLNFSYSSINNKKFKLFCQGCAAPGGNGCRGHIYLANIRANDITSKSMQSFVNIPSHILQKIKILDLSHNQSNEGLDRSACDLLAKAVSLMSSLDRLQLNNNPIGSGGAVQVIKALHDSAVSALELINTRIGVPDCEVLSELLRSSHIFQGLFMYKNHLSSESVASIITGLSLNSSLTTLNVSNSHFSTENMVSLASILSSQSQCTLTKLRCEDCQISSEGTVKIADALCSNNKLKSLVLSCNPIGEHVKGVIALAKMLVENKTLELLTLLDCHISGQGAIELAAAVHKNSCLRHLDLRHNPIGVDGASSMSDMLQYNTSLQNLRLVEDSIREEGVRQLINSLKHNQTLKYLWLPQQYEQENIQDNRVIWW